MNKKIILISIAVIIIVFLVALATIFKQDYRILRRDGSKCVTYTKDCTCLGSLTTMMTYPAQYKCQGLNFCKDINITECKNRNSLQDFSKFFTP